MARIKLDKPWEEYLDPVDRERLMWARDKYTKEYFGRDQSFDINWIANHKSPDFYDALEEAETPQDVAEVYYDAEMRSYPFFPQFSDDPFAGV